MKFSAFLKECYKKEVIKMLSIYVVSSWVLIQVLSVLWQPLGLTEKSITYLVLLLLVGLPLYVLYIWRFHLRKFEGEPVDLDGDNIIDKSVFQKMYFSVLAVVSMFVAVAVVFIVKVNFSSNSLPNYTDTNKIAVLRFGNNTGDEQFDVVSKMTTDWIAHGITEKKVAQVISPEIVDDYANILKVSKASLVETDVLNEYFKPEKIISGNFYLQDSKLLFQSSITDGDLNETLISFKPIKCDSSTPLACIEELKQVILGYLKVKDDDERNLNLQDQTVPPKFEAYQYLIEAKSNPLDSDIYLDLLNKSIEVDNNYFEPKVLRVSYFYNKGNYKKADSLLKTISTNTKSNKRQKNLMDFHKALLLGKNDEIHRTMVKEYNLAPFDWDSNSTTMVTSLQFVYQPKSVDSIFNVIPMTTMDIENCSRCEDRLYVEAWADIELKSYQKVIKSLSPFAKGVSHSFLKKPLIAAYIRSGDMAAAETILSRFQITTEPEIWKELFIYEAKMMLLVDNVDMANSYFDKVLDTEITKETRDYHADALYYKKDYLNAESLLETLYKEDPTNSDVLVKLAISKLLNKKPSEAEALSQKIEDLKSDYQYGIINYHLALYHAANNDENKVRRYLLKSVAEGMRYYADNFHNDPELKDYFKSDSFKGILTFWH